AQARRRRARSRRSRTRSRAASRGRSAESVRPRAVGAPRTTVARRPRRARAGTRRSSASWNLGRGRRPLRSGRSSRVRHPAEGSARELGADLEGRCNDEGRTELRHDRGTLPFPSVKRYTVVTFGCQMNAHDSERIKGMLEELGLGEAPTRDDADVVVFNTCTIREKPDTKLAAYLGEAGARKREHPEMVIAVGGCYAEAQRERIFSLYPQVDVAFGPGTISHLGDWLGAGG